ncbi:endolytic transglycosylase MltG [Eggerthella lenta]|uniref:endolytic transglycosylase MltG n=1 Tax=Eggerthella lenta TaxID=84112 RepID=UPI0018A9F069|nr:endolytic transglycosylase MltG [Eggerthella lenta]MDB1744893.1 endolytic transglycosylase MltG [Eggerthella lenta]
MPQHRKQVTYSQRPNHAARSAHARGERQFRTYDTSYIRPKKSKAPAIVAAVLAVLVVGGLAWGALTLFNSCSAQSVELLAEGQEATITVAEGAGAKVVGEQLAEARLVSNAGDFTKRVNEMGVDSQLKPGTYTFAGGMSLDAIINQLTAGPVANALTIPEGSTLEAVAQSVATFTENRITADAFTAAASDASAYAADYDFLADAGTNSLEGFLFPKTYEIGDDAAAESVVRMMLDQFKTETSGLNWSYPQSQGLTIYDAVKLASIVERESSGDEQIRAQMASVFYNRLNNFGDPNYGFLQSDATTAYELGHDPTPEDIKNPTPFNTYTNTGLPPTPICSPGLDCLQAVCNPAQTNYFFFYFAPDESGTMQYYFSETYEEHQQTFS